MKTLTAISSITLGSATGTLTSNNTNVSNNDTVTIGSKTYTFKTNLTPTEGEIHIGGDADASLLNLIRAINHTGTPNTDYKCAAAHPTVSAAASVTAHAFAVTALTAGFDGNSIATTETAATLSWGGTTLSGGEAITVVGTISDVTPTQPAQRVTVAEFPTGNTAWSRAHRITDSTFTVSRIVAGALTAFGVTMAMMGKIAATVNNVLTWAPNITTEPSNATATATAAATGTLTSDNVNVADADTVTVGSIVYRFKNTMAAAYDVKIGADADATLLNLIKAINLTGIVGTNYFTGTLIHPTVSAAASVTAHAFLLTAKTSGLGGNAIATTETSSHLSFAQVTLTGGTVSPASFTTVATSEIAATYAWSESSDDVTFTPLSDAGIYAGTTTATLTITPTNTSKTGYYYRCAITNGAGTSTTDSAQLTVP